MRIKDLLDPNSKKNQIEFKWKLKLQWNTIKEKNDFFNSLRKDKTFIRNTSILLQNKVKKINENNIKSQIIVNNKINITSISNFNLKNYLLKNFIISNRETYKQSSNVNINFKKLKCWKLNNFRR